ncbi:mannitol-1-phosphate 5-dehydrogenase [Ornithinibacillus contaminans]|uniref:mannitol-1-phosphate 5-dehydrogenase n=1 Tax=Ornithinibacillus contaminans TaxID=694055 RepID=UPI00064E0B86|nr:mannitol-1-phosphate 5-dehydrogenase [Ornithinibacillus contaminans]
MLAVHFGAGNIGRGFIGALLYQSNFHTTFVDVNERVIDEINEKQQYKVVLADETKETLTVSNISGINSVKNPENVIDAIAKADLVTTAVGPTILPLISELIAKGLQKRLAVNPTPLNLIACENMVGGSDLLKEKVYAHLTEAEIANVEKLFGFPNAAVDRIVPNQVNTDLLEVTVEPYYEWVVDESSMKGDIPQITGITYVQDLKPYIERKLFTVNTGHAVPAYLGHLMGYRTIYDAMKDETIQQVLADALMESGEAIIQTYHFDRQEHIAYIHKIISRFQNPHISDEVTRVGRGPIRKLGPNDRLIRPATMYMDISGNRPTNLAKVIAAALVYTNAEDQEAVQLQSMITEQGVEKTLQEVSGLSADHPLIPIILTELDKLDAQK